MIGKDIAFAATMAVLMDAGYRARSADIASGQIIANATSVDRVKLDLRGLVATRQMPIASAFIEETSTGTRIRINFSVGDKATSHSSMGERAVHEVEPYRIFFDQLDSELQERQSAQHVTQRLQPIGK